MDRLNFLLMFDIHREYTLTKLDKVKTSLVFSNYICLTEYMINTFGYNIYDGV